MSKLKTADGTELEVKEGVLLDQHGNPVDPEPSASSRSSQVLIFRNSWLLWCAILIAVPVLFTAGVAVAAFTLTIVLFVTLLRFLSRMFRF